MAAPPAEASLKGYRTGTHRLIAPEETVRRGLRVAPVMGITRIANVTGLDCVGVPVVMVCRPNSRSLAVAQGKGLDLWSAKASGLMESIESYHAESITLPLRLCSYEDLCYTEAMADVEGLPLVRDSLFSPSLRLLWCEGRDLLSDERLLLPYELVHTDYRVPLPGGSGCFLASSNGLASGNHLLEAVSHAISEVVERDAATLWAIRKPSEQERTRIDLQSIDDESCLEVLEKFARARLNVGVWDMTSDVGIPAFRSVLAPSEPELERHVPAVRGMGCHPARGIALLRALTEAAQSRLTLIAGSRDDAGRAHYVPYRDMPARGAPPPPPAGRALRSFADVPDSAGETFEDDVDWELERLRAAGITQVILVDLTKEAFRIPVVRVVIPGLETTHEAPGYFPGKRARALLAARA